MFCAMRVDVICTVSACSLPPSLFLPMSFSLSHSFHTSSIIHSHTFRLGAHYDIEGVADSAVLVLAKFTNSLNPSIPKPRVAFGRDPKACAAVEAMLLMVNRCVLLLLLVSCY